MNCGVTSPAESLMFASRWSYTGTYHLSCSFSFLHFDIYVPQLSVVCENAWARSEELSPVSVLFLGNSLHMRGYQHHRRPSRMSWYSPCQHHRGAEWLAEFHTLVQESQRTLRACPRNASWPQPQSLALRGSKWGRKRKCTYQVRRRVTLTDILSETYSCPSQTSTASLGGARGIQVVLLVCSLTPSF